MSFLQLALTALGSVGFYSFIQFLITRKDNRKDMLNKIMEEQKKQEKDSLRTQLLLMMSDYPQEHQEIMLIAHRYFGDLHANWFCSSLFQKYLEKEGIQMPKWFKVSE